MQPVTKTAIGTQFPSDTVSDLTTFEPRQNIDYGQGLTEAWTEGVAQGTTTLGIEKGLYQLNQEPKNVSEEEWKKSPNYRDGLDFKSMANKDGFVSNAIARYSANNFDAEMKRQQNLSLVKPGLVGASVKDIGYYTAQALDPFNIILGSMSFGLGSTVRSLGLIGKAGFAARAGIGFTAGTVAGSAQTALQYEQSKAEGMPISSGEALENLLNFGLWGGALHGFFGPKTLGNRSIVTPESLQTASQNSVVQTFANKRPNINTLLQMGFNDARQIETENAERTLQGNQYGAKPMELDSKPMEMDYSSIGLEENNKSIDETKPLSDIDELDNNDLKISLLHNHFSPEKLQEVINDMKKLGKPKIRVYKTGINNIYQAIEGSHRLRAAKILNLIPDIEVLDPETNLNELEDIDYDGTIVNKINELGDIDNHNIGFNTEIDSKLNYSGIPKVTKDDLQTYINNQTPTNVEHDFSYDSKSFNDFLKQNEELDAEEKNPENFEEGYNALKNSKDLDDFEKKHFEALDQEEETGKNYKQSLKDLFGCIFKGENNA